MADVMIAELGHQIDEAYSVAHAMVHFEYDKGAILGSVALLDKDPP
jgi:hypothetical protein